MAKNESFHTCKVADFIFGFLHCEGKYDDVAAVVEMGNQEGLLLSKLIKSSYNEK